MFVFSSFKWYFAESTTTGRKIQRNCSSFITARVFPSSSESSLHTARHTLYKCYHISRPNCPSHLADSLTQFGQIGGRTISRFQIDIWSQTCSIGFMSGLIAGRPMTSTSCWPKSASCNMLHVAGVLSCTNTNFPPKTPVAHVWMWSLRIWMKQSLWYSLDSSLKMQPAQWVTKVPDSVPLAPLMTMSPMHKVHMWTFDRTSGLKSSSQKSVYNSMDSHVPAKMQNRLHP